MVSRSRLCWQTGTICLVLSGCTTAITPPSVEVIQGELVSAGLLDQRLQLLLCVTNPNTRDLALSRISFAFTLAGDTLAKGLSEAQLDLPGGASAPVRFAVSTSTRDFGTPVLALAENGTLNYVVSGKVVLRNFDLISFPYSVAGQITLAQVAGELFTLATTLPTRSGCPNQMSPVQGDKELALPQYH